MATACLQIDYKTKKNKCKYFKEEEEISWRINLI